MAVAHCECVTLSLSKSHTESQRPAALAHVDACGYFSHVEPLIYPLPPASSHWRSARMGRHHPTQLATT